MEIFKYLKDENFCSLRCNALKIGRRITTVQIVYCATVWFCVLHRYISKSLHRIILQTTTICWETAMLVWNVTNSVLIPFSGGEIESEHFNLTVTCVSTHNNKQHFHFLTISHTLSHMVMFGRWRTHTAVERTCSVRDVPMESCLFRCVSQLDVPVAGQETRS